MRHKRTFGLAVLWLLMGAAAQAQDFDPANPPEPSVKYKVTTAVSPVGAGYASGAGKFVKDVQAYISTSANQGFKFKYWTLNGVQHTTSQSFYYTVGTEDAQFVAVYEYDPQDPDDPTSNPTYRLYLGCQPAGACSFNRTSGEKVETGTSVTVSATPSQGFDFLGWYEGETKVSSSQSFSYTMTAADHTLTARFEYNPVDPDDPTGSGEGVDNMVSLPGDANGDGTVDVKDVVATIDYMLENSPTPFAFSNADINGDNTIDVKDVVGIIDIIIGN